MARPLVQSKAEVLKNFESFVRLRNSRKPEEVKQYQAYLKSAKVLVVEKVNGQREYAPSRFVGYKGNSLKNHEAAEEKDGTVTTPQLESLFAKWCYDPVESQRYVRFCKKHGITKEVAGLSTPLKFIFAGYPASAEASRSKTGIPNSMVDTDDVLISENSTTQTAPTMSLNQILYGPPGTGKTYHTVARAVALLEGISDEEVAQQYPKGKRAELRQKFEDYRLAQRIEFVTFHQAFSYEDFIEGIKPLPPAKEEEGESTVAFEARPVQYDVVRGVFRRICDSAAAAANPTDAPAPPDFDELYDGFVAQLQQRMTSTRGPLTFYTKEHYPVTLKAVNQKNKGRLTFLHATTSKHNHHIDKSWTKTIYTKYASIEQIKKLSTDITQAFGGPNASLQWVVFNELKKYEAAWVAEAREKQKTMDSKPVPPFVLIIDEINRGNVANIFGELITLLEDDKRAGNAEALTITLPYSKEEFSVPSNLYILGTMNTADRSVEALDTALRRRFSFTEMLPQPELLPIDIEGINLQEMLRAINVRLEQLLDHEHCIGHALLMRVNNLIELREAFRRSILPLLKEYFFGDWGKIGLVLGGSFIQQVNKKKDSSGYKLLPFGSYNASELAEKPVYKLADIQSLEAKAFQDIYAS
jgi:5-methylcytosine-specific restriction endonuclease McrBC GTP-binding regulatory subunit McrB